MQYSRLIAFFITLFTFGLLVSGAPVEEREVDKRDVSAQVLSTVQNLQTQVAAVVSQLSALDPATATLADVEPLVGQVESLVSGTTLGLSLLNVLKRDEIDARQLGDITSTIASVLSDLISTVTGALSGLTGIAGVTGAASGLSNPLSNILTVVEGLVPGVLTLVTGLLTTVLGLLGTLGLTGLLGILAL
ncbi:hypothetical protein DACRYDRAFT_94582 [Dacryopinax primogenitus]|uniref:Sc15 protein n=1 Tax=Dacryopinax primogenitus (strain DJM 731) TaxID=1858805 RepID=M5FW76_DACPD|nr:uncharacterized protein DACRYDRAFT_94582 [Dacryopinax primogenitus]EJU02131.1 hypothetical protein DACRYDRAFT_94582 [Dacryopinax primogenitus]